MSLTAICVADACKSGFITEILLCNEQAHRILNQVTSHEDELRTALHEKETRFPYQIDDRRIEFERLAATRPSDGIYPSR